MAVLKKEPIKKKITLKELEYRTDDLYQFYTEATKSFSEFNTRLNNCKKDLDIEIGKRLDENGVSRSKFMQMAEFNAITSELRVSILNYNAKPWYKRLFSKI